LVRLHRELAKNRRGSSKRGMDGDLQRGEVGTEWAVGLAWPPPSTVKG
jgi:hypothetical protein